MSDDDDDIIRDMPSLNTGSSNSNNAVCSPLEFPFRVGTYAFDLARVIHYSQS